MKEVNFDGLVGPTHYFGGLAYGNIASMKNKHRASNPKKAALQGLEKMKLLHDLGIKQGVLPPHERPDTSTLENLGFNSVESAHNYCPRLFYQLCNSSSMWSANSATVTPSCDSADEHLHITPANLVTQFHRSIEASFNSRLFKAIFSNLKYFVHHEPLPSHLDFADEGAANHIRFEKGHHLFVYGRSAYAKKQLLPKKYPARQTKEASEAIVRRHLIPEDRAIFAQQNPKLIDAGVFHNDVISTGNEKLFLYYEDAFVNTDLLVQKIGEFATCIKIYRDVLPLKEALSSYLFNSQIVTVKENHMALIAPMECKLNDHAHRLLKALVLDKTNPIKELHFVDVKESMQNGGGPACLRLRVLMNEKELAAVHQKVIFTDALYLKLKTWINKHYREELTMKDLLDTKLLQETKEALDELSTILGLEKLYDFQR